MKHFRVWVVVVTFILCLFISLTKAEAYTFDGEIDPIQFFSYEVVKNQQFAPDVFVLSMKSGIVSPMFAINCVRVIKDHVMIFAYAYYDKDNNFRQFILNQSGHYKETIPDEDTTEMLKFKLKQIQDLFGI